MLDFRKIGRITPSTILHKLGNYSRRGYIKHLVANTIIVYNVSHMSAILHGISSEGCDINKDIVSLLAPIYRERRFCFSKPPFSVYLFMV
ncbi:Tn3 family transposase (plasmid) [Clostridium estertheticum]|nr:Tn3 family transposase [Clostridium estertheticum]WLC73088.1 Tn3 family transposase [Clostridium estertheticum]